MAKRKVNLPLIEVIIVSVLIHLAALLILGGITIYQYVQPPEPELEAPPVVERPEPEKVQQQVRVQQRQQQSTRPTQRITVSNISELNVPTIDINLPQVSDRVGIAGAIGAAGQGRGGLGRNLGGGGIDISRSAVNFFGIRSQGERIMFIIDATRMILEDQKGGIPAYNIIKEEIVKQVNGLSPGTLFNVMFFDATRVYSFSDHMLPATTANKEALAKWIEPINKDFASVGNLKNNVNPKILDIDPMRDRIYYWVRAIQIAMEQGCDAIFLMTSRWMHHARYNTDAEREAYYREIKWTEKDEQVWQDAVKKAQEWLANENAERRKRGQPERVVQWIGTVVAELYPKVRRKPSASFTVDEVMQHIQNMGARIYDKQADRPPINIVMFLGSDEKVKGNPEVERFQQLARRNRGRFNVLEGLPALRNVTGRGTTKE